MATKTKEVVYLGAKFQVPSDAKFIAADANGRVFCYKNEPHLNEQRLEYSDLGRGDGVGVGTVRPQVPPVQAI